MKERLDADTSHERPSEHIGRDPEKRGVEFMRKRVEESVENAKPYKFPLRERAKYIGDEKLLDEIHDLIERDIRGPLLKAFGENPTPENILQAREFARNNLITIAGVARSFAMHYRLPEPFRVGAAILALRATPKDHNPWAVLFDANTKLNADHKPSQDGVKWCAEQYLLDRISEPQDPGEMNIYKVVSVVIVAEVRADDRSGIAHKTLTPCAICRDRMRYDRKLTGGEEPVLSPKTEVYTIDAEKESNTESRDIDSLHRAHGETIEVD